LKEIGTRNYFHAPRLESLLRDPTDQINCILGEKALTRVKEAYHANVRADDQDGPRNVEAIEGSEEIGARMA
jgi:hypothetical protein